MTDTPRYRFVATAAKETQISRDRIYRYIRRSEQTATPILTDTIEGRTVVDIVSLQAYAATAPTGGRPRKIS